MDVIGGINVIEKIIKTVRFLFRNRKKNSIHYLEGTLNSGLDISHRIIALFEAHDVRKTQIYRLLGDRFPEIKPSLEATQLQRMLNGDLIDSVCELFGVRKAWVEGEAGRIYEPLYHYKDLPAFNNFIHDLKARNPDTHCFFTALKPSTASDDLYQDHPRVGLFFSEEIADIDGKSIYRYYPIYGPFPWDHSPALYHLAVFFNIVYKTPSCILKGYVVPEKHVERLSAGVAIPMHKAKITDVWHPEDYAYSQGYYNGRIKASDWKNLLEYFDNRGELHFLKDVSGANSTGPAVDVVGPN